MENTVDKLCKTYNMFKTCGAATFVFHSVVLNSLGGWGNNRVFLFDFPMKVHACRRNKRVRTTVQDRMNLNKIQVLPLM